MRQLILKTKVRDDLVAFGMLAAYTGHVEVQEGGRLLRLVGVDTMMSVELPTDKRVTSHGGRGKQTAQAGRTAG